jgi:hypothetical protein
MNLRVVPYLPCYVEGARELNRIFDAAGVYQGFRLSESLTYISEEPFGSPATLPFEQRQYLILDDERVVGGFLLQEQMFHLRGRLEPVSNIQSPISLGAAERKYAMLGGWMMKTILAKKPLLFAAGMGGKDLPFPRLLKALRWHIEPVPFQFYVLRPARFLRDIRILHSTPARSSIARIGAATGLGWAGIRMAHWASGVHMRRGKNAPKVTAEPVSNWDSWTDELWEKYRQTCSLAGVRDRATLLLSQPLDTTRFQAYKFHSPDGRVVGWSSIQTRQMEDSVHFGNLLVKTILDSVCLPGWEDSITQKTLEICSDSEAHLAVSNQRRAPWVGALAKAGFLSGPSNYLLAISPALTALLEPLTDNYGLIHLSRADSDGRWQL